MRAEVRAPASAPLETVPPGTTEDRAEPPADTDLPALDSLDENSDYSAFFSPRVSEQLRRAALRKLFHTPAFNVVDGLDDYAEDYRNFAPLGDIVTAHMRHRMEVEAERMKEKLAEAQAQEQAQPPQDAPVVAADADGADERARDTAGRDEDETNERTDDPSA